MAKLYFRYGTMGSAKTLNLLAVAHNYQSQNRRVLLVKPELDSRFGRELIRSRAGLEKKADLLLKPKQLISLTKLGGVDCVLVDEVQFLDSVQIEQLRCIATSMSIPVICYGLRSDFKTQLFDGSKRLLELADTIEEIKTTCNFCTKKAVFNMKFVGGEASISGPQVDLGAEEKYMASCSGCYYRQHAKNEYDSKDTKPQDVAEIFSI